jgi:hypothetical protein
MFLIEEKLVSLEIFKRKFVCNLQACKGACCWEGDYGAPLESEEIGKLNQLLPKILPFLSEASRQKLLAEGVETWYEQAGEYGTTLMEDGSCAFLTYDALGIAKCGIEKAWEAGAIDFKKPISCHLYPIRIEKEAALNFEALNYDEWDICSAACSLGSELQVPVFRFVKEALIRQYGPSFYEALEEAYEHYCSQEEQ